MAGHARTIGVLTPCCGDDDDDDDDMYTASDIKLDWGLLTSKQVVKA